MLLVGWRFPLICASVLLLSCAPLVQGQIIQAQTVAPLVVDGLGRGTVPLDGPWQFHTGDDTSWANPAFDDSNWEQLDISRPWGDQGHWDYAGRAWYRRQ